MDQQCDLKFFIGSFMSHMWLYGHDYECQVTVPNSLNSTRPEFRVSLIHPSDRTSSNLWTTSHILPVPRDASVLSGRRLMTPSWFLLNRRLFLLDSLIHWHTYSFLSLCCICCLYRCFFYWTDLRFWPLTPSPTTWCLKSIHLSIVSVWILPVAKV